MKLAHNFPLWNFLRRLFSDQRHAARRSYTITVPAPRSQHGDKVVELRSHGRADERTCHNRRLPPAAAGARVSRR